MAVVVDSFSSPPSPTAHRHHRHRSNCRQYYSNRNNNKIIILYCGRSRSGGYTKRLVAGGGIIRDDTATGLRLSNIDNGKTNRGAATNNNGSNGSNNIRLIIIPSRLLSRDLLDGMYMLCEVLWCGCAA